MNLLGFEYIVNEYGRNNLFHFKYKHNALKFARAKAYEHGNDWIVVQRNRKGQTRRIATIGAR